MRTTTASRRAVRIIEPVTSGGGSDMMGYPE